MIGRKPGRKSAPANPSAMPETASQQAHTVSEQRFLAGDARKQKRLRFLYENFSPVIVAVPVAKRSRSRP